MIRKGVDAGLGHPRKITSSITSLAPPKGAETTSVVTHCKARIREKSAGNAYNKPHLPVLLEHTSLVLRYSLIIKLRCFSVQMKSILFRHSWKQLPF